MNLIYLFIAVIQLARESIGLTIAIHSLFKKDSTFLDKRKKH